MDWISVKDRLPKTSDELLAFFPAGESNYDIVFYDCEDKTWSLPNQAYDETDCEPNYWMPLPKPPKE